MYTISCSTCGRIGLNDSRQGAESRAESHAHRTGHALRVEVASFARQ